MGGWGGEQRLMCVPDLHAALGQGHSLGHGAWAKDPAETIHFPQTSPSNRAAPGYRPGWHVLPACTQAQKGNLDLSSCISLTQHPSWNPEEQNPNPLRVSSMRAGIIFVLIHSLSFLRHLEWNDAGVEQKLVK